MPVWGEVCRNTILDLRTWEELEEKLKELQEKVPDERRPEPLPFLYRGQENSCWTITTTLERPLDGRESMPFGDYYLSIYRAKPEIESYTGRCCMIQLRREWGRFSNFSFRTPQRRISAYPARPSG